MDEEYTFRNPEEYYYALQEMYIDESDLDLTSDFGARSSIVKLERLKSDVLDLRLKISKDMRTIRNMYLDESIIKKPKVLGLFSIGKNLTPTQKRKKLIKEREKNLIPYQEIKDMIDDYIEQIEELENYIKTEVIETYSVPKYRKISKK
ncbi:MAG: hypothetical protein ACPK7O_05920 [Methanobacterium sp.]